MARDTLLGTFEQLVLLAVMRVGKEAFPPAIRDHLEESMGRRVSRGAVYVTLDRLEQRGFLSSRPAPPRPGRGGRPRRELTVTADGIAALQEVRGYLDTLWGGLAARDWE